MQPPTGHYRPEAGAKFVEFSKAIKLGGTTLVRYSFLHFWSLSPPDCFKILDYLYELVFDFGGGVLVEDPVGVSVIQKF